MPIRAELRIYYGQEWRTEIRPRILSRAGNCCEFCSKPNSVWIETTTGTRWSKELRRPTHFMYWRRMSNGEWYTQRGRHCPARPAPAFIKSRLVKVVLTIAHLDHNPENNSDENLRALCQWCHLIHDKEHHRQSRQTRKDEGRPLLIVEKPGSIATSAETISRRPMTIKRKWPADRRAYLLETGRIEQLEKEEIALALELPARLTMTESERYLLLKQANQADPKKR